MGRRSVIMLWICVAVGLLVGEARQQWRELELKIRLDHLEEQHMSISNKLDDLLRHAARRAP